MLRSLRKEGITTHSARWSCKRVVEVVGTVREDGWKRRRCGVGGCEVENKEMVVMAVVVTMVVGGAEMCAVATKSPCHFLWRERSVESEDLR